MSRETGIVEIHRRHLDKNVYRGIIADEGIVNAFLDLIRTLPEPKGDNTTGMYERIVFYPAMSWQAKLLDKPTADALIKLGREINDGMKRLYQQGKEDGKNLLVQLNNGEVSETQFLNEKKAI